VIRHSTLLGLLLLASGCTHSLHQVYVSDFGGGIDFSKDRKVEAQAEQFVVLGFVTQTDHINQAHTQLQNECPRGEILGITTEHWTSHGFLSWTNKLRMQGYCKQN
jgi:hypothetical protein